MDLSKKIKMRLSKLAKKILLLKKKCLEKLEHQERIIIIVLKKIKITINQLTGIECPNSGSQFGHSMPAVRAISAHHLFSRCPLLGL